jgi:SAM-dependent methyltransferase
VTSYLRGERPRSDGLLDSSRVVRRALGRGQRAARDGRRFVAGTRPPARRRRSPRRRLRARTRDPRARGSRCRVRAGDAAFDGVTCQLGLIDIGDLAAALGSIRRVLRTGGWFVFVIGHPCFLAPRAVTRRDDDGRLGCRVTSYLDEEFWRSSNPDAVRGRVGNYHRPLSVYLNAALASGFRLDAVEEPHASQLLLDQQRVYQNLPMFFAARALTT